MKDEIESCLHELLPSVLSFIKTALTLLSATAVLLPASGLPALGVELISRPDTDICIVLYTHIVLFVEKDK